MVIRVRKITSILTAVALIGTLGACSSTTTPVTTKSSSAASSSKAASSQSSAAASTASAAASSKVDSEMSSGVTDAISETVTSTPTAACKKVYTVNGTPRVYVSMSTNYAFKRQADSNVKIYPKSKLNKASGTVIDINPNTKYQQIDGFGASFTDSAAYCMYQIPQPQRDQVMKRLFDANAGIGLSLLRNPMGATDFARTLYTYDDIPQGQEDMSLSKFSIAHDLDQIIPLTKQALKLNPKMKIIASPWTAPPWMKTDYTYLGNTDATLRRECYDVYSKYFVKYIQAYAKQGIPIYAVTPQNEPGAAQTFPAMIMNTSQEAEFVGDYLRPAFDQNGIKTKIFAYDWNWDGYKDVIQLLFDAGDAFDGVAFHHYAGDPTMQASVAQGFPDKPIIVTEASGYHESFSSRIFSAGQEIITSLRNYGSGYIMWNVALNSKGGPANSSLKFKDFSICDALITVDTDNKTYSYSSDYYILAHFSKFIQAGASRIDSTDTYKKSNKKILNVACLNPNGTITTVLLNEASSAQLVKLVINDKVVEYTLPAASIVTITWNAN